MNEEDEKLITEYLKENNGEAFRTLVFKYTKHIYNFVRYLAHRITEGEAEDITQEIFIKIWKKLPKYKMGQNFKVWLFTVARNTTIDFLRKRKQLNFSDLENEEDDYSFAEKIPDEELLPDAVLQKMQDSELLLKVLEKLKFDYQTVLTLHYQEEMTFDEISKILNKPLNTVKSHHRRALIELRKMLS